MTKINTHYVTAMKVNGWLALGQSEKRIYLNWNGGEGAKKCKEGYNGTVHFDSCTYVANGLVAINE